MFERRLLCVHVDSLSNIRDRPRSLLFNQLDRMLLFQQGPTFSVANIRSSQCLSPPSRSQISN